METDARTADLILDAAETLFARQGFTATTIKQIGSAAGVNPALIYYHFGNKEALYRELLSRLFGTIVTQGGGLLDGEMRPDAAVRGLVEMQSAVMASRPSMPRLLARELIDHHAEHASEQITHLAATLFTRLCDLIRAGQEGGIFRRDLDPRFAALSTVSLVPYAHIARPAVGLLLGRGVDGPTDEEMRAYGRHAAEFALSALLAHRPWPEATEPAKPEEEGR